MTKFTVEKRTSPMQQMLRAKCHWGFHIGQYPRIRAFGDPLVRARKAGRLMNYVSCIGVQVYFGITLNFSS